MKTFLKVLAIVVGVLVLAVVAAIIIVPMVVDPNDYKPEISQAAKEATGRELIIEGDLSLSIFPWIGVETGAVRMMNPEEFGGGNFVKLDSAAVKLEVWPLLHKKVIIDTVVLENLELHAVQNAQGRGNWEFGSREEAPAEPETPSQPSGSIQDKLKELRVGGVEIKNANITYANKATGYDAALQNLNLEVGAIVMSDPSQAVPVSLSCTAVSKTRKVQADIDFSSTVSYRHDQQQADLADLELTVDAQGEGLPMTSIQTSLAADVTADIARQAADITGLTFTVDAEGGSLPVASLSAVLKGDAKADLTSKTATVSGLQLDLDATGGQDMPFETVTASLTGDVKSDTATQVTTVSGLQLTVDAKGEKLPGGEAKAELKGDIQVDMQAQTARVTGLQLTALDEIRLTGDVNVTQLSSNPTAKGQLQLARMSPKEAMRKLGLEPLKTKDPEALTGVAMTTSFVAGPSAVSLDPLSIVLDGSELSGMAAVKDFQKPDIKFTLATKSMNLDNYMPPEGEKKDEPEEETGDKAEPAEDLPEPLKEQLRKLVLDGRVQVDDLVAANITMKDALVIVTAENGILTLQPASAIMYGGQVKATMKADLTGDTTQSRTQLSVSEFQLGQMFQDLLGTDRITGTLGMNVDLSGRGISWPALRKSLDGKGSFEILNGHIRGFQIIPPEVEPLLKTQSQMSQIAKATKEQNFQKIMASFSIKDGLISNNDLQLLSDFMTVVGKGNVNLAGESIDYSLLADIPQVPQVPIRVKGPLYAPAYGLNEQKFVENLATGAIKDMVGGGGSIEDTGKEAVEGVKKGVTEDLGEGVGKTLEGLGGLLGGSKKE